MGHNLPVYFFHIDKQKLPQDSHDIHAIESLEIWGECDKHRIWKVTSRNWSYPFGLHAICEELEISGLGFVVSEFACLDNQAAREALAAAEQLLLEILNEIPTLSNNQREDQIWWLHKTRYGEKFSSDIFRQAFDEAEVSYDIDDGKYKNSVVGFYSFLKSLREAMFEAISTDRLFVYYRGRL
ncbi:MAG: hypothetical protein AAGH78_11170 [Cyanobacteria bacterium P01_H01_bin.58]